MIDMRGCVAGGSTTPRRTGSPRKRPSKASQASKEAAEGERNDGRGRLRRRPQERERDWQRQQEAYGSRVWRLRF